MKKGWTLLEALVVVVMFTFLFAGLFAVLTTSDRSWQTNRDKLIEQQQARRGIDQMVKLLRQSYPTNITISDGNQRIDFYIPVFDNQGNIIEPPKKITFKLDSVNPVYLLKVEKRRDEENNIIENSVIIAKDVQGVSFGGNSPVVNIQLTSRKQSNFTINTQVTLRNTSLVLPASAIIEEPAQGEF